MGRESVGFQVSDDTIIASLTPVGAVEGDGRGSDDAEALEQRFLVGGAVRHVRAQERSVCERALYGRIREGIALHLLAGGAPVGGEIDQHPAPVSARLRNLMVEIGD